LRPAIPLPMNCCMMLAKKQGEKFDRWEPSDLQRFNR
jgi:hypothetical protein